MTECCGAFACRDVTAHTLCNAKPLGASPAKYMRRIGGGMWQLLSRLLGHTPNLLPAIHQRALYTCPVTSPHHAPPVPTVLPPLPTCHPCFLLLCTAHLPLRNRILQPAIATRHIHRDLQPAVVLLAACLYPSPRAHALVCGAAARHRMRVRLAAMQAADVMRCQRLLVSRVLLLPPDATASQRSSSSTWYSSSA